MKLGVSYNVFDAEELLEPSILAIRNSVDYINIVYQTTSNAGEACSSGLLPVLKRLSDLRLVDEVVEFHPKLRKKPHKNEVMKRNVGLKLAKMNKCTHFMSLDSDEFYDEKQLILAKKIIEEKNIDRTAVKLTNYFKEPCYQMVYKGGNDYFVSFIFKISFFRCFSSRANFPVLVDKTRRVSGKRFLLFDRDVIEMHHMTLVRKDIRSKLKNSSATATYYKNGINEYVDYFNEWEAGQPVYPPSDFKNLVEIKKVNNNFDI